MTTTTTGRTVTVTLPPKLPLLSSNQRPHWATKARRTRLIRDTAAWTTRALREAPMERVVVTAVVHPKTNRQFDPDNYHPTAKAALDGVVDAGLLPDDDTRHVIRTSYEAGPKTPEGWRFELHIEEIV